MTNTTDKYKLFIKCLIPIIILILISGIVFNKPLYHSSENEFIQSPSKEFVINLFGSDSQKIITKIIHTFYFNKVIVNNTFFSPLIINPHTLYFTFKNLVCINQINKYPKWSKSTFS